MQTTLSNINNIINHKDNIYNIIKTINSKSKKQTIVPFEQIIQDIYNQRAEIKEKVDKIKKHFMETTKEGQQLTEINAQYSQIETDFNNNFQKLNDLLDKLDQIKKEYDDRIYKEKSIYDQLTEENKQTKDKLDKTKHKLDRARPEAYIHIEYFTNEIKKYQKEYDETDVKITEIKQKMDSLTEEKNKKIEEYKNTNMDTVKILKKQVEEDNAKLMELKPEKNKLKESADNEIRKQIYDIYLTKYNAQITFQNTDNPNYKIYSFYMYEPLGFLKIEVYDEKDLVALCLIEPVVGPEQIKLLAELFETFGFYLFDESYFENYEEINKKLLIMVQDMWSIKSIQINAQQNSNKYMTDLLCVLANVAHNVFKKKALVTSGNIMKIIETKYSGLISDFMIDLKMKTAPATLKNIGDYFVVDDMIKSAIYKDNEKKIVRRLTVS
jgi:hypothetical protein